MNITVKSTRVKRGTSKKGDYVNTLIDAVEGSKWTTFVEGAESLNEGDVIEIDEYEEGKGNYRNRILKYHKVESATPEKKEQIRTQNGQDRQAEITARAKNTALMQAVDLAKSEKISLKDITKYADEFLFWLMPDKLNKPSVKQAEKDIEELWPEETGFKIPTNPQELAEWSVNHGKEYGTSWICENLSINKLIEIKDFEKAYYDIKEIAGWEN